MPQNSSEGTVVAGSRLLFFLPAVLLPPAEVVGQFAPDPLFVGPFSPPFLGGSVVEERVRVKGRGKG